MSRASAPTATATTTATAERMYQAFEKATSEAVEKLVRDPRFLAMGAGLMRSQLLWARAMGLAVEASLAPFAGLASPPGAAGVAGARREGTAAAGEVR